MDRLIENNLRIYLRNRPALLAPLRAKEAYLFQKLIPLSGPVLDIGCGDGFFADIVVKSQKKIQKFDFGLDVAGSRNSTAESNSIYKHVVTYDGTHIPFKTNYFPSIVSNSTLEHVSDIKLVLKEIVRVLKPGGYLYTTVIAKPWAEHYFGNKIIGKYYEKWMTEKEVHVNLYTYNEWNQAFRHAGLKIIDCIGHANPIISTWTDVLHYTGIPNLISYRLFNKWVLWPSLNETLFPVRYFCRLVSENVAVSKSAALFYKLRKYSK